MERFWHGAWIAGRYREEGVAWDIFVLGCSNRY